MFTQIDNLTVMCEAAMNDLDELLETVDVEDVDALEAIQNDLESALEYLSNAAWLTTNYGDVIRKATEKRYGLLDAQV